MIIIISLASAESQPVSNFVDKTIIVKQVAAILKENANAFVKRHQTCPAQQPLINFAKFPEDHTRLF